MADENILETGLVAFLRTIPELSSPTIKIEPSVGSQSATLPRCRYTLVAERTNHLGMGGSNNLREWIYQLDVVAQTYIAAKRLAYAVNAKDGWRGTWNADRIRVLLFRSTGVADVPQTPIGGGDQSPFVVRLTLAVWFKVD